MVRGAHCMKLYIKLSLATACIVLALTFYYTERTTFYDVVWYSRGSASENVAERETSQAETTKEQSLNASLGPNQKGSQQYLVDSTKAYSSLRSFSSLFVVSKAEALAEDNILKGKHPERRKETNTKKIAVIVKCANSAPNFFSSIDYFRLCPGQSCQQTRDLENANAVVFQAHSMTTETCVPKFRRPSGQKWIMWTNYAPVGVFTFYILDFLSLKGQFNWTMTHRLDSDIVAPYGRLQEQELPLKNYTQIYDGKNTTAAWFVNSCSSLSGRSVYVERMQNVADIHIFGPCGNYSCPSVVKEVKETEVCFPTFSRSYFFCLAFEASLCKDYVAEFFQFFQNVDVIPVVRGGADYKRFFPPGTFIDASDFASPEDLAKFLLNLSRDRKRYIDMLKEKSRYTYRSPQNAFCELCDKLQRDDSEKWYPDLRRWFLQGQCHEPFDI